MFYTMHLTAWLWWEINGPRHFEKLLLQKQRTKLIKENKLKEKVVKEKLEAKKQEYSERNSAEIY